MSTVVASYFPAKHSHPKASFIDILCKAEHHHVIFANFELYALCSYTI